ncbi:MAG TPA: endoribonuclease MazF [Bryocella sp.]|nr:endoribonuclease MazF [Bryocella sp.]
MVRRAYVPEAGDLVWASFDPQAGHEQAGRRPALVLSPAEYNGKAGLVLACPVTSQIKGYPFEVAISSRRIEGVVLADQVRSLDWRAREFTFADRAPEAAIVAVKELLMTLLGVPQD